MVATPIVGKKKTNKAKYFPRVTLVDLLLNNRKSKRTRLINKYCTDPIYTISHLGSVGTRIIYSGYVEFIAVAFH